MKSKSAPATVERKQLLVVDGDPAIRRLVQHILGSRFNLSMAATGREGLAAAAVVQPDAILLDVELPDLDGLEVIRQIRGRSEVSLMVVSEQNRERDRVAAFEAGADAYLAKPFGDNELRAQVDALLRRNRKSETSPVFMSADLRVDLWQRRVAVGNREVSLTPTEFEILRYLVVHAGKAVSQREILGVKWRDRAGTRHLLRVNICNLRQKLEGDPSHPRHILTEPGFGYRLR
ncbi:response regulator transcription factor [Geomonas sp. Red32]|uniref:response regulator transcription factor n=1 Tax=Geomonas sp. Red32 TaxID=2912856 RepID=UPI00202CEA53|nr:response regulator transcription factor [Geomonas sp. Red32]MCM0084468.1 response regulator transcription factor [Geomonas sp. Red32]